MNHHVADLPSSSLERSFVSSLLDTAKMAPDRVAIADQTNRLTYRQLVNLIDHLARAVSAADLPAGPIGVLLDDTVFYVVAMLAVVEAGRAVLPLDTASPPAANNQIAIAAGLAAIIVEDAAFAEAQSSIRWLSLVDLQATKAPITWGKKLSIHDPALLLATSGSTGEPKITVHSQFSFLHRLKMELCPPILAPGEPGLVLGAPRTFGVARNRLLVLLCGGSLILFDMPRLGLTALLDRLQREQCRLLRATPQLMKSLARLDGAASAFATLRLIRLAGEKLLHADLRAIRAVLPQDCKIYYSMGSTEADVASWIIPHDDHRHPLYVASGHIKPNVKVQLIDETGAEVAPGESGELVVNLELAALGDWVDGKVDRTRFEQNGGQQRYYTGDIARIGADGVLVMLGRRDNMVKIRGNRVEPGMVETVIRDLPWVLDAAVLPIPENGTFTLHGFVVPSAASPIDAREALRRHLRATLPNYMHPAQLEFLPHMPIGSSGKRDDTALLALAAKPKPSPQMPRIGRGMDNLQRRVQIAWRRSLPAWGKPGLSFDATGGDSLRMMEMIFRLERSFGVSLPVDLFCLEMTCDDVEATLRAVMQGGAGAPADQPGPTVFLLPGAGGDEPGLARLRSACAPWLSMVQLEYGNWRDFIAPGFDFAAMVETLAAQVEASCPTGPIHFVGYSLGGQLAWVIAAGLEQAGRQVGHVLLIDTPFIYHRAEQVGIAQPRMRLLDEWHQWRRARQQGRGSAALARVVARRLLSPRARWLLHGLAGRYRWVLPLSANFYLSNDLTVSLLTSIAGRWRRGLAEKSRLQAPVTLLRAAANPHPLHDLGWGEVCLNLRVVEMEGDHFTILAANQTPTVAAEVLTTIGHSTEASMR